MLVFTIIMVGSLLYLPLVASNNPVSAHRSGCHRFHSCPSDNGSYVCGDLGYDSQCQNKSSSSSSKSIHDKKSTDSAKNKVKTESCENGYHKSSGKCVKNKVKTSKKKATTESTNATLLNGKCQ